MPLTDETPTAARRVAVSARQSGNPAAMSPRTAAKQPRATPTRANINCTSLPDMTCGTNWPTLAPILSMIDTHSSTALRYRSGTPGEAASSSEDSTASIPDRPARRFDTVASSAAYVLNSNSSSLVDARRLATPDRIGATVVVLVLVSLMSP